MVADLTDDHAAATAERAGLAALPEYTAHADLVRRRDEVARADAHTATLDGHRTRARDRVTAAASAVAAARGQLDSDLAGVADGLRAVAGAARAASAPSIAASLPDPPAPATEPRRDEAGETTVDVPQDPDVDLTADLAGPLTAVGDALRTHRTTVRDVAERASGARRATETADAADVAAADALAAHEAAAEQAAAARRAARAAADEHADAVAGWTRRLGEHVAAVPPAEPDGASGWLAVPAVGDDEADDPGNTDLRRAAEARRARARHAADDLTATLTQARTVATTRVTDVEAELAQWRAEHARVEDAGELALPRASWRTDDDVADGTRLASLVDFRDHLGDAERAGLEAALEASGLLAAAVDGSDGTGTLRVGDLVVGASAPADGTALDTLLAPVDTGDVPVEAVAGVLAAVGVARRPGPRRHRRHLRHWARCADGTPSRPPSTSGRVPARRPGRGVSPSSRRSSPTPRPVATPPARPPTPSTRTPGRCAGSSRSCPARAGWTTPWPPRPVPSATPRAPRRATAS